MWDAFHHSSSLAWASIMCHQESDICFGDFLSEIGGIFLVKFFMH